MKALSIVMSLTLMACAFAEDAKPKVAVFPLGGSASEKERERAAFSIRSKLDRQGIYEPIDGYTMKDVVGEKKIDFLSAIDDVIALSKSEKPDILIWGEYGAELKLNILDLRDDGKLKAKEFAHAIDHATDVRFAVEALVESLPGSKKHEHVTEEAVVRDEAAEKAWRDGPNLFAEGAFDKAGDWRGILAKDKYPPEVVSRDPKPDEVIIRQEGDQQYLQMNLTRATAETYGLACLSGKIAIEPDTRYRISFRYKSDGPVSRPFIKGYFRFQTPVLQRTRALGMISSLAYDVLGEEREIYRRQVPPQGATKGEWIEVVDELNPQHTTFPVRFIRVDFYAYLHPGLISYDDVVIKAVGAQARRATDEALDKPVEKK